MSAIMALSIPETMAKKPVSKTLIRKAVKAKKPSVKKALVKAAKGTAARRKPLASQKKADAEAFEGCALRSQILPLG